MTPYQEHLATSSEPTENPIPYDNTGETLRYIDPVKMYGPVWKKQMCNELGRLYQVWKTHAETDTIEFILHIYKPKHTRKTYVRAVCDTRTQKKKLAEQESLMEDIS